MKTTIITCLLILFVQPPVFGATNCKIVEYKDRSELICTGDEKARTEPSVAATPSRSKTVETIAENQAQPRSQMPKPESSTVTVQQSPAPSETATQQTGAAVIKTDKAADNLSKRRALAERNTRNLAGYTSATAPPSR